MKRLLIMTGIFTPDIGGPASYARTLGMHLAAAGTRVTVLTYSSVLHSPDDSRLPFTVKRVWNRLPWGIRHAVFLLRAIILAGHIDAILALNTVSAGLPALWASRIRGKPLVVRVVGDYAWDMAILTGRTFLMLQEFQKQQYGGRIGRLRHIQTRICEEAQRIIVPSQCIADLVSGWGIAREKITVIYTGVSLEPSPLNKEEARKTIGVSGHVIVSAGRMVPLKGFRMLIKMMPQLLQANQFFRLVIIGDGPDMTVLRSMVQNLGLERKVSLVGAKRQADFATYLAAADMFVLNSGFEAFPHVVLEALQAGVPVVTTAVGGNREIIRSGENGFLVRYNDEFNLVEAIRMLMKNTELRDRFIGNGKRTTERFSVGRMLGETTVLLNEIHG